MEDVSPVQILEEQEKKVAKKRRPSNPDDGWFFLAVILATVFHGMVLLGIEVISIILGLRALDIAVILFAWASVGFLRIPGTGLVGEWETRSQIMWTVYTQTLMMFCLILTAVLVAMVGIDHVSYQDAFLVSRDARWLLRNSAYGLYHGSLVLYAIMAWRCGYIHARQMSWTIVYVVVRELMPSPAPGLSNLLTP